MADERERYEGSKYPISGSLLIQPRRRERPEVVAKMLLVAAKDARRTDPAFAARLRELAKVYRARARGSLRRSSSTQEEGLAPVGWGAPQRRK